MASRIPAQPTSGRVWAGWSWAGRAGPMLSWAGPVVPWRAPSQGAARPLRAHGWGMPAPNSRQRLQQREAGRRGLYTARKAQAADAARAWC